MAKELGGGLGSGYPSSIDTDTSVEVNQPSANKTLARAAVPNDLADAIINVETELGTDPAGSLTDVKTYLQTEHNLDGTHDVTKVMMLSGIQTITGQKTFNANIVMAAGKTVDGIDVGTETVLLSGNKTINDTKTFENLKFKMGTGTDLARAMGVAFVDTVQRLNTGGSAYETLGSYTLPANSLITTSGGLRVSAFVTFSASGGRKETGLFFGSQRLDNQIFSSNSEKIAWESLIFGSGSSQSYYTHEILQSGTSLPVTLGSATEDLSSNVTIAVKASGNTASTITYEGMMVEYLSWQN